MYIMKVVVIMNDERHRKLAFDLLGAVYIALGFFPKSAAANKGCEL